MSMQLHLAENAWSPYGNVPLLVRGPDAQGRPGLGKTYVNRGKYSQKLANFCAGTYPIVVPANGRNRTAITPLPDQGGAGDTEFYYWVAQSTASFAVMITNMTMGQTKLMNQPVEGTLLFGTDMSWPGRLLQPIFVVATNSLDFELTDLSGSSNTIYLSAEGCQIVDPMNTLGMSSAQIRGAMRNPNVTPYWLTFDNGATVTATASTTTEFTMTVPSDADFNAWSLGIRATTPASLTVEIFEGNRRRLQNNTPILARQIASVTGQTASLNAASVPLIFPFTHTFQRKTQVIVRLTESSGSNQTVSMAWGGQLVYYEESPPGLALRRAAPPVAAANMRGLAGAWGR